MSRFIDAPTEKRCKWTVRLADGSSAQCGRARRETGLCLQHYKMAQKFRCCGGNDEPDKDHCMDCITGLARPDVESK